MTAPRNTVYSLSGFLIGCIVILCNSEAQAQNKTLDSLKQLAPKAVGKQKVDVMNGISRQLWESMPDSGIFYAEMAEELAKELDYKFGEAEANRAKGVAHLYKNQPDAKENLNKALELFENLDDKKGIASTHNNLGSMWSQQGENDSAIASYQKSLKIFEDLNDKDGEGSVLNYIGIVYQREGDYTKASQYALKGLEARSQTKNYRGIVFSMINAGNMYLEGGLLEPATELYERSIAFAKENNIPPENMAYNRLARVYVQKGDFKSAEEAIKKSTWTDNLLMSEIYAATGKIDSAIAGFRKELFYSSHPDQRVNHAEALTNLSSALIKKGKKDEALGYARQAFLLSDSIRNKKFKSQSALLLSSIYGEMGDYKNSLNFLRIANTLKDSISGSDFQTLLAYYDSKSTIEKEQARVKVLSAEKALQEQKTEEQRKSKNLILLMALIALGAAAVVIVNIQRQKKRIQGQSLVIEEQRQEVELALSELKSTQTQLIQREKLASLGELTAGIAHEIQNPLNFVNNFSEVNSELITEMNTEIDAGNLQAAGQLAKSIFENQNKIVHHGKRADAIVKSMLQHSHGGSGKKELTDINALADEYLRLSYHGLRAKDSSFNVEYKTDFDPTIGKVKVVPQEMGRVLLNLFNNAFFAVSEKEKRKPGGYRPKVSVSTKGLGERIEIRVSDNGMGISPNLLDKIFQPFFTTKPTGQGTGLGLSLSYDIVTKGHGGKLYVETEDGVGSSFVIEIPNHQT